MDMRTNRELTPDQIYWSSLIKPVIGVDHDESVEMDAAGGDDFAQYLQHEMDRVAAEERTTVPTKIRGLRIGYPH
jgi:hypothetical protein